MTSGLALVCVLHGEVRWSALQPVLFGGVRCAIPGCKPAGWRCKLWQLALRTMTGCVLNHVTLDSYLRCFALRSVLVWALNRHPFVCDYKITTFRRGAFHNKPIRADSCRFLSILVDSCRFFFAEKKPGLMAANRYSTVRQSISRRLAAALLSPRACPC